jgi:hypothetical protein
MHQLLRDLRILILAHITPLLGLEGLPLKFRWNLYDAQILAFCTLAKPASREQCQGLLAAGIVAGCPLGK